MSENNGNRSNLLRFEAKSKREPKEAEKGCNWGCITILLTCVAFWVILFKKSCGG
jgi:hypothetical protein